MLYEYNGKIYVKPLVNKIVEVEVSKKGNEFDIKPTDKMLYLTEDIKKDMISVTNEQAAKLQEKPKKSTLLD